MLTSIRGSAKLFRQSYVVGIAYQEHSASRYISQAARRLPERANYRQLLMAGRCCPAALTGLPFLLFVISLSASRYRSCFFAAVQL